MSTYKVIQDIEAEDKLLGPLTLRQFIYAIIVVVSLFIGYKIVTAPGIAKYFVIILIPHTVFFAVLAAPFGHDQSNEVWLLAKVRFFFKPRRRIWDQTGIKELVTITVPRKIERQLTKGFSQEEARNRLKALANTIDSRGWAVKNVNVNLFQQPAYSYAPDSDRLVNANDIPKEVPIEEIGATYDILDELESPAAQHMTQLINTSDQQHHQQLATMMQQSSAQQATSVSTTSDDGINWFAGESTDTGTQTQISIPTSQNPLPNPTQSSTIPVPDLQTPEPPKTQAASPMTPIKDPAIINLATNDDLNISTIARQADKAVEQSDDGEVVISLR